MKLPKHLGWVWLGLFVGVGLALTSCGKKISPQEARQSRLDWNLKTLVGAYEKAGHTSAAWDESAKLALTEFARARSGMVDADEDWSDTIGTDCAEAIRAGCDDPMIRYLYIRNQMNQAANSREAFAEAFTKMAQAMQQSSYPPIRKFYAELRTFNQLFYTYQTNVDNATVGELAHNFTDNLIQALDDKTMPPEEVYQACSGALDELGRSANLYEDGYNQMQKLVFKNWPNESTSWLLKGEANLELAWRARGGGYADSVTPEGWKLFAEHLATAEDALNKAWRLNPTDARIPTLMIRVDEGAQKSREEMELWFSRAMATDPKNYKACKNKLHYLYPQWYGSREQMIAFGRECVASTNWDGYVPLILVDAHSDYNLFSRGDDEAKEAYWKQPDVWPDIKAAYDRFFELNPKATSIYKNYASYAYHAGQWDAFIKLASKVRPTDYNFFGNVGEFERLVQLAKEHAGKPAAVPQK